MTGTKEDAGIPYTVKTEHNPAKHVNDHGKFKTCYSKYWKNNVFEDAEIPDS